MKPVSSWISLHPSSARNLLWLPPSLRGKAQVLPLAQKALHNLFHHLPSLPSFPFALAHSVPDTQASSLLLKHVGHITVSGHLHMLLPLPGTLWL